MPDLEITPTPKEIKKEFKSADLREIPLSELTPNPYQPRTNIHPESLLDLTASIRQHGILEPILVAKTNDGYKIIAGERRFRAAKVAGLKVIPAMVKETTEKDISMVIGVIPGIIENLRKMSPVRLKVSEVKNEK